MVDEGHVGDGKVDALEASTPRGRVRESDGEAKVKAYLIPVTLPSEPSLVYAWPPAFATVEDDG
jgi:hypothetical protein